MGSQGFVRFQVALDEGEIFPVATPEGKPQKYGWEEESVGRDTYLYLNNVWHHNGNSVGVVSRFMYLLPLMTLKQIPGDVQNNNNSHQV